MIYKKTTSTDCNIENLKNLYISSFPEDERRDFNEVLRLLDDSSPFNIIVATKDDSTFAGFIGYWDFDNFIYIEHFAVEPELRGQKIGEKFLAHMASFSSKPIVLEVELPEEEMSIRRIKFYERNGYILREEIKYIQPPYSAGKNSLELKLMTLGSLDLSNDCNEIKTIHKEVYGVK